MVRNAADEARRLIAYGAQAIPHLAFGNLEPLQLRGKASRLSPGPHSSGVALGGHERYHSVESEAKQCHDGEDGENDPRSQHLAPRRGNFAGIVIGSATVPSHCFNWHSVLHSFRGTGGLKMAQASRERKSLVAQRGPKGPSADEANVRKGTPERVV
jgi:hypothetical protein